MRKLGKWVSKMLAVVLGATLLTPLMACGGGSENQSSQGSGGGKDGVVHTISSSLLDGKVANLLSASGIAIQDKTQNSLNAQAASTKASSRMIVASAEESLVTQPETELVKETESGVEDVHFHDGDKGDYTEWNNSYGTHHHNGEACDVTDCAEISDEILAEEANAPTIISLEARVNKLYNAGKFTFLCVSSAIEGEVRLLTQVSRVAHDLPQQFFFNYGAWLNVEEHYFSEDNPSFTVSYMNVKAGDKSGVILVKRSDAEEGYHYSNYWSDDFNQSYLLDNETGKTYSLSQLPHIYSVRNGVIVVKTDTSTSMYQPKIEDDKLVLSEIIVPEETVSKYGTGDETLVDIYGNVVFVNRGYLPGALIDEYGEVRENGFIFASMNEELVRRLQQENGGLKYAKVRAYTSANRYLVGNDGHIYRFDFRGDFNSVPVHVLNEQGEWTAVPETTRVVFTGSDRWFAEISVSAADRQYMLLTQISGGKTYFVNALLGSDIYFTRYTNAKLYHEIGWFVGVSALPTDGSPDTAIQEFMTQVNQTQALDAHSIVYTVGNTAFAYEDKAKNELVIWDRATETRQTISVGEAVAGSLYNWHLIFMDKNCMSTCFQANTANGTYYIPYKEKNPDKAWSEYSTQPIEKTENLDAYYELLTEKLEK